MFTASRRWLSSVLALVVICCLPLVASCSAVNSKTAIIEIKENREAWKLVDATTKEEIKFTTLKLQGKKVMKTDVMYIDSYTNWYIYMGGEGDQLGTLDNVVRKRTTYNPDGSVATSSTENVNTKVFLLNGGTIFANNSTLEYTLNDGILDILITEKNCKEKKEFDFGFGHGHDDLSVMKPILFCDGTKK